MSVLVHYIEIHHSYSAVTSIPYVVYFHIALYIQLYSKSLRDVE